MPREVRPIFITAVLNLTVELRKLDSALPQKRFD
jgi:hypothetical protein